MLTGLGWICTGAMRPGTLRDGLEYAWPWLLLGLTCAVIAIVVFVAVKQKLVRYLVGGVFILCCVLSLAFGAWLFGLGKDCRGADVSEYERRLEQSGLR